MGQCFIFIGLYKPVVLLLHSFMGLTVNNILFIKMGGNTNRHGFSTRNLFMWNPINERHEDIGLNLVHPHFHGDCTIIPADANVLKGCSLG